MIGIVTPLTVNNYGSKLQAYAVQKKMDQYGLENEIVLYESRRDHRPVVLLQKALKPQKNIARFRRVLQRVRYQKHGIAEDIERRRRAISSLDRTCYRCAEKVRGYERLRMAAGKYEAIVCGSDQVWNPLELEPAFYSVEFVHGVTKIAYSPSFGVSKIPEKMQDRYRAFVGEFSALSAREISGSALIEQLTGRKAPVTLDPTLMLSREDWEAFAGHSRIDVPEGEYIFCYFLGESSMHREAVRALKARTGCRIVTMPHFKKYVPADEGFADLDLYDVSPADFVKLIASAAYVCTDSFHASVFSILFGRRFFSFERFGAGQKGSTNTRIHSLLQNTGLMGRMVTQAGQAEERCREEIDYQLVYEKLDGLRAQTEAYLNDALAPLMK